MKLNLKQIKSITCGAVSVEELDKGIVFHRFTKEQEDLYEEVSKDEVRCFYDRCLTPAGVKLMFKTDSSMIKMKVFAEKRTSRNYFSVDIFADSKAVGYIDNFEIEKMHGNYTETELLLGECEGAFELPQGIKTVAIYLPWSVRLFIKEISLDDDSSIEPVKPAKKLLAYGDSITQGYDALRPSNRYVAKLADKLGAQELNKGIGGEFFRPELATLTDEFNPDYITVAYGTNDWGKKTYEEFKMNCRRFYETLSKNYPFARIFAISPIWRKDYLEEREFGPFESIENYIKEAVLDLENVTFVSGFDLVLHDEKYYADLCVHPTDEGFDYYFDNLYAKLYSKIN